MNSKEENCPNYVQEFGLCSIAIEDRREQDDSLSSEKLSKLSVHAWHQLMEAG